MGGGILPEIDKTQKYLQNKGLGLDQSVVAVQSLQSFLLNEREKMVENAVICARDMCDNFNIPAVRRVRRKRRMDGEETIDVGLSADDEIRRDMIEIVEVEMNDRLKK